MSRYYCPFCSARYQFNKSSSDGILICGLCGDPLLKKPILNLKSIIGLLAVTAFISPLLIMIIFLLRGFNNEKLQNNSELIVLIPNGNNGTLNLDNHLSY